MQKTFLRPWQALFGLFVALALIASCFQFVQASQTQLVQASRAQLSDPPANQVAVKLKFGVAISTILSRYNASQIDVLTETNLYILQLPGSQTADQMLPILNADADLYYAEPNYYAEVAPDGTTIGFRGTTIGFRGTTIGFRGTGEITPTPVGGAHWEWNKIGMADAQKISNGQGIIVAVLDTGLTPDHPLLSSSITAGYDFVDMNTSISDLGNSLDDDGNGLVDEFVGHGTHVSGIILTAAPGVQIMPIRVLNSDGIGTYWEVSQGIHYAVDHGAKVINMSLSAPRLTPSLWEAVAYATSHGVVIVAAAGTGPGPNYPPGYSDPLAVLGIGASDQNDNIASFSGGLPADMDVFAPGVDIYSAYPYNGYALGSGTSMAAPIVAAEAAMLIARHPDWSRNDVIQRILAKTAPVAGSTARRVDLAGALNTGIEVDHSTPDLTASPTDEYILPRLRLFNNTPQDIPLSELKMRYWYTIDTVKPQTFLCDYATPVGCSNLTGAFTTIAGTSPNKTGLSDTYLEVGFTGSGGSLVGGSQVEMYLRVLKTDLSSFAESNDYSYDPARPDMARWDRVTVYRNGVLVWGIEPTAGSILTATPTRTATVAVASTATNTPVTGTYEAESAALSGGAAVATDHTGYSGTGFVAGYYTGTGQKTSFTVNVATAGSYNVTLRYANSIGSAQTESIYVNGVKVATPSYPNLANWNTWADSTTALTLNAGNNTITYQKDTGNGCINLDYITVQSGTGPTPTKTNTPVGPTATRTNTPIPPTATNTPVGPTNTPAAFTNTPKRTQTPTTAASTATRTNTPIAPTATASAGGLKIQLEKDPAGLDNTQKSAFYIKIINTGATAVSGITARMYFTLDGSYSASRYVLDKYYDQCWGTIQGPTLFSGSTYYFTLNCGTNSLAAGAMWQVNMALHLNDWSSNLNTANDWWHTTGVLPTTYTDWTYLPAYVNSTLVWGAAP